MTPSEHSWGGETFCSHSSREVVEWNAPTAQSSRMTLRGHHDACRDQWLRFRGKASLLDIQISTYAETKIIGEILVA
jgi:hypothetical protein